MLLLSFLFGQSLRSALRHRNDFVDSIAISVIWIKLSSINQFFFDVRHLAIFVAILAISMLKAYSVLRNLGLSWIWQARNIRNSQIFNSIFSLSVALIFGWLLVLSDTSSRSSSLLLPILLLIWPSLSALHHMSAHPLVLAACWITCMLFLFVSSSHFRSNVGEGIVMAVLSLMLLVGSYSSHALPRLSEERLSSGKSILSAAVSFCKEAEEERNEEQPHQQQQHRDEENAEERAQRYLIANVAHDMKSPLAAFESGCDALKTSLERITHFIAMCQEQMPSASCDHDHSKSSDAEDQALLEVRGMMETLKLILGTCGMVQAMVNRYTDYAKAQLGVALHAHVTSFAVEEVVQSIADIFSLMQQRVKITVKTAAMLERTERERDGNSNLLQEKVLMVRADRQWVFESMLCLVSNAVKYCSNNNVGHDDGYSKDGEVIIRCFCVASPSVSNSSNKSTSDAASMMMRIEVEDNGCGVPADLRNELFTSMNMMRYTTGGTGLGLYILAKRVITMGGEYGYKAAGEGSEDSKSKTGSIFWFTFPGGFSVETEISDENLPSPISIKSALNTCCDDSSDLPAVPSQPISHCKSPERSFVYDREALSSPCHFLGDAPKQQIKFLVVDDAMPILRMTRRVLENEGHMVLDAVNGRDALDVLTKNNGAEVDVVLMDIQMPVMDGIEATKQFRQLQLQSKQQQKMAAEKMSHEALSSVDDMVDYNTKACHDEETVISPTETVASFDSLSLATNSLASNDFMLIPRSLTTDLSATPFSPTARKTFAQHNQGHHHRTIIIGCSANSDHITIEDALAAGMDAFIPKPVTMKKVYDTLQQLDYHLG